MTPRQWVLLLLLAATWGASYLFIKVALADFNPAVIVFARTALASLVLLPIALRRGALGGLRPLGAWLALLAAVQVAGPFLLIAAGERSISSSLAGILVASAPIFVALFAPFLDREERSGGWRLVGVAVGIVGVVVLLGVDVGGESGALLGALMVLLAGAGYALGGFLLKRRFSAAAPVGVAAVAMALSALATLAPALATRPAAVPGALPVAALVALGVLGTGLAFFLFYTLISQVGPARSAVVAYIAPGFAVVYGVTLLGESFTLGTLAGLALVLGGSYVAAGGASARRPPSVTAGPDAVAARAPGPAAASER